MLNSLLFFAIKPPPAVALAIDEVRQACGISRRYPPDRLHITLRLLGLRHEIGDAAVAAARDAAAGLFAAPFRVIFDRIDNGILQGTQPIEGLLAFHATLDAALARSDLPLSPTRPFRPHITLVYGGAPGMIAIDGISWLVEEFLLIESVQGEGRHDLLARWPLRPPP